MSKADLDAELERVVTSGDALAYVVMFNGDHPGRIYALKRSEVILGRADDADVHIPDASVSSHHARIINRSQGFEIVDLDSTNGTFVGRRRVSRSPLRNGDHVTAGSVEFVFLKERPTNATIRLPDTFRRTPGAETALVTTRPPMMPPMIAPRLAVTVPPAPRSGGGGGGEEDLSLADAVRKAARAYAFIRERRLLIATWAAVGMAFGVFSILVAPPGVAATGEIKLLPHISLAAAASREDDRWQNNDQDSGVFVKSAERALTTPDLIRSTLVKLGSPDPADAWVRGIATKLKIEETGDHVFRATYKDKSSARPTPLAFLNVHLKNYVQSEISKSLRELSGKVDFLRDQVKAVETDMDHISDQRAGFREANADRLPEDSEQTHASRFELETRRAQLLTQIHQLQGELNAELGQLKNNRPEAQRKFQQSETYRTALAEIERKLTDAYSRGLKDGHPEVQRLQEEKQRIQAQAKDEMRTATPTAVRESDPNYQQAQNQAEKLEAELAAARASLGETDASLGQVRRVVQDLPRVEQHLADLEHRQKATKELHGDLYSKLKQAEIQLNLEKVSAESRYDISPPRLERPRRSSTLALRAGLGLLFGLFVAGIVVLMFEARRVIAQTLTATRVSSRIVSSRDRPRGRF